MFTVKMPVWRASKWSIYRVITGLGIGLSPLPFITTHLAQSATSARGGDEWASLTFVGLFGSMSVAIAGRWIWNRALPFPADGCRLGFKDGCKLGIILTFLFTAVAFGLIYQAGVWNMCYEQFARWGLPVFFNLALTIFIVSFLTGIQLLGLVITEEIQVDAMAV